VVLSAQSPATPAEEECTSTKEREPTSIGMSNRVGDGESKKGLGRQSSQGNRQTGKGAGEDGPEKTGRFLVRDGDRPKRIVGAGEKEGNSRQ